jgi:photosystem II stability/assembly factor-like uncharacterized protein
MIRSSLLTAALVAVPTLLAAQGVDSSLIAGMRWLSVGPAHFEGRIADITGIPFPSPTTFLAPVAGGVWKSTNGGVTFRPTFDDKPVVSMGALAVAPSDTMQVWAGTGEQNSRNSIEPGYGVYKSTDGGITWRLMGLEKTQHIGRIVVHPRNPNIVYVAALGAAWKTNPERGLYKTEDGGQTWKLSKFISDRAGFVDVELDPSNPDIVWATSWERIRGPYYLKSGGPGSALWKSTDAGATWTEVKGNGWPETQKGRINVALFPGDGKIAYAIVEADSLPNTRTGQPPQQLKNGMYKTTDGGANWEKMHDANTRPFYYSMMNVHPRNPNRVWFSSTPMLVSNDGGRTAFEALRDVHIDTHALWIDPGDPEHMAVGNDGGVYITWDGGGAWDFGEYFPIGQFYEVSYDFRVPYYICGGAQDNGSHCGPSRRKGNLQNSYWFMVTGGDGFYTQQHPKEPWIVWSESQGGNVQRTNIRTGEAQALAKPGYRQRYLMLEDSIMMVRGDTMRPPTRESARTLAEMRQRQVADSIEWTMRYNWNTPFLLSPHNPDVFYMGGSRVLKSNYRGDNLFPISPDLSKKQWGKIDTSMTKTGGITQDPTGAETYGTVVALAESYVRPGWLMAGTDDGNVWTTQNDGNTWQQIPMTKFPGIATGDIYTGRFEPSHFDANTFYVTFDNHRNNDFTPYLYVTNDYGQTFRSIVNNLPKESPADYVRVLREDPHNRDLLFAGTSRAVYVSVDRGASWQRFMSGMPNAPMYDLQIHPRDRELIVATHGRGFWIVDINPLEQIAGSAGARVMSGAAYLFAPRVAYDYGEPPNLGESFYGIGHKTWQSPSPPHGAEISYRVAAGAAPPPATEGRGGGGRGGRGGGPSASILISDASGDTVAVVNGPASPGLHKVYWNFRGRPVPVRVALGPSQLRDSTNLARRITAIFDSVGRAGTVPQASLDRMKNLLLSGNLGGVGGRGGGGGGGGRGAAQPTGWVERPGEGTEPIGNRGRGAGGGGGGGGGGGAGAADPFAEFPGGVEALAILLRPRGAPAYTGRGGGAGEINQRLSALSGGGGGGGRGGGFGGGAGPLVPSGDYLVTLTIGGQSYRQKLRVERLEGFGEVPK